MARGTAVDGVSDLDDFALLDRNPNDPDLSWREGAAERLTARHTHVTGVGLDLVTADEIGGTDRFSELALQMGTQTACVWGEDVIPRLPRYRPGVLVANNVVQIQADIEEAISELERDPSHENTRYWCRRISKNIVRAGFSLNRCGEVLGFLDGFGSWMVETADGWLDLHNPSRELALRLCEFPEEVRFSG